MGVAVDVRAMVAASRRPETIEVRGEVQDAGAVIADADVMIVPSTRPHTTRSAASKASASLEVSNSRSIIT